MDDWKKENSFSDESDSDRKSIPIPAKQIYLNHSNRRESQDREPWGRRKSSGGSTKRESFGRARSQPQRADPDRRRSSEISKDDSWNDKDDEIIKVITDSGTNVEVTLKESKSDTNLNQFKIRDRGKITDEGSVRLIGEDDNGVTRHMMFKEALYTGVHMLGKPSKRFPATKEEICLYAQDTFCSSEKELQAVIEHVKSEPFPLTIVNTKVRRGEGFQSLTDAKPPNPYCVAAIETEGSVGKKDWQQFTNQTPLNKAKKLFHKKNSLQPLPEHRINQVYDKIPRFIRTKIVRQSKSPVWEQIFQCLALQPSTDILTAEVWDQQEDDSVLKAIQNFSENASKDSPSLKIHKKQSLKESAMSKDSNKTNNNNINEKSDDFLGKVTLKVRDLLCTGLEKWFHLEGKTKAKDKEAHGKLLLQIWFVHAYRHGKHYTELVERKVMLECLWDWILGFEKKKHDPRWDGSIPKQAISLLFQYAIQNGISEDTHAVIRWNAYAKHHLDLQSVGNRLDQLDKVLERRVSLKQDSKSDAKLSRDESQMDIEESILLLATNDILPTIRNHLNEPQAKVEEACKSYKKCRDVLSKFEICPAYGRITWLFENAIRLCVLEWYQAMFVQTVTARNVEGLLRSTLVNYYTEVMNQVNILIQHGFTKWGPLFWLNAESIYMIVVYDELQKMVNHDIEAICWFILEHYYDNKKLRKILLTEDKDEEQLCRSFFSLYCYTQVFVEMQEKIFEEWDDQPDYSNLNRYYQWFRPILVLWLGFSVVRGSEMITKCINIDNVSLENIHTKTSTSALDTANVFHQLIQFWEKLRWPDICENYVIIHFLFEVMCYYTVLYAKRKHEKLELEGYFDTEDRFDISERLCTALNNVEYVKMHLEQIPFEIKQEKLLSMLEAECGVSKETEAYRLRLHHILAVTFLNVENIFKTILRGLGNRIRPEVSNYVQESLELLQSRDPEHSEDALEPILQYLEENIIMLDKSMLQLNFARMLQLFWNSLCQEILIVSPTFKIRDQDEQIVFFARILKLFPILEDYFQGGETGLTQDELNTPTYQEVIKVMKLYTLNTQDLIAEYYRIQGQNQIKFGISGHSGNSIHRKSTFGTLKVRVIYTKGKLNAEIISAADLIPSDDSFHIWDLCKNRTPNNDPFVEVEILPIINFANARTSKTEVRWKTLNPLFEEKFQWDVTIDECKQKNAVMVFTVKDFDFLSKNDFLGEATLPLTVIPGVADRPIAQPMNLHLSSKKPSQVLEVLKSRTSWDNEARDFCSRQDAREILV